ncbi:MAG: serine/threonine-protein kinase [Dermatophilaceae bacterium]|nr:serine/threonine protein kinase [Intrasporangiaceae bacterium]
METEVIGGDEPPLAEHSRLGPYRLVQQLGEGGMGVVHLALDRQGRAVAIKVLRPHVAHDPDARARLAREVETLELIRHPNVAPVLDADLDGPRPYLVTKYVPGPPLDDYVAERGPLDGADLTRLAEGLASALDAIHEAGVVHRDLKPGNVLVVDGEPMLIDFGIAHAVDDIRLTMTGLVMGTPGYLAPEIVEGAEVSEATDWWGWAATLAFAATGQPPFGRGPMEAVLARVARGESDLRGTDPDLRPLLRAALNPDPDARPSSGEVVEALRRYEAGESVDEGARWSERTQVIEAGGVHHDDPPPPPPLAGHPEPARARAYPPAPQDLSDWEAVMDSPAGVDPRIGRPGRTGEVATIGGMLVALGAAAPLFAFGLAVVLSAIARTADRSVTSLILRRTERGIRRSDVPLAVAASPLHFVIGLLSALLFSLVPLVVAVGVMFAVAFAVSSSAGGVIEPIQPLPLAAGALSGVLVAWWGPGGASMRRGTRSLVRGMTPTTTARQVFLTVIGVIALGSLLWLTTSADLQPTWWPSPAPPQLP